jgi:hypothetical protein
MPASEPGPNFLSQTERIVNYDVPGKDKQNLMNAAPSEVVTLPEVKCLKSQQVPPVKQTRAAKRQ